MRSIAGIVSLLVVLAIVSVLVKNQLATVAPVPDSPSGASPQQPSQAIPQQVQQSVDAVMQQARPMPEDK